MEGESALLSAPIFCCCCESNLLNKRDLSSYNSSSTFWIASIGYPIISPKAPIVVGTVWLDTRPRLGSCDLLTFCEHEASEHTEDQSCIILPSSCSSSRRVWKFPKRSHLSPLSHRSSVLRSRCNVCRAVRAV